MSSAWLAPIFSSRPSAPSTYTAVIALIGQSNMVGRLGPIDGVLDSSQSDILMYSAGSLVTATHPLDHFDETPDTVGPGLELAKQYLSNNADCDRVVLVPAADGGTGHLALNWNRLDPVYTDAVARVDDAVNLATSAYGAIELSIAHIQGEDDIDGSSGIPATDDEMQSMKAKLCIDFREDVVGATQDTPIAFGGLPPNWTGGTGLAAINTMYGQLGSFVNNYSYADPSVPTVLPSADTDNIHYTAASSRDMGVRLANAIDAAKNASVTLPTYPTPPAGTYGFYYDVTGVADGHAIKELSADVKNTVRRCYISGGNMRFGGPTGTVSRRIHMLRDGFTPLTNQDFSLRLALTPDTNSGNEGLVGIWVTSGNRRSWLLRRNATSLEFFISSNGSTSTSISASGAISAGVETLVEVTRTGSNIEMFVDGVSAGTATFSGSAYDDGDNDLGVTIGDFDNLYQGGNLSSRTYFGQMRYVILEYT